MAPQIWLVLRQEIAISTGFETPQLDGEQMFLALTFHMKTQILL